MNLINVIVLNVIVKNATIVIVNVVSNRGILIEICNWLNLLLVLIITILKDTLIHFSKLDTVEPILA